MKKLSTMITLFTIIGFISCVPKTYIVPDYKEYTSGGLFEDKYWSSFFGGKNVKIEGVFLGVETSVLSGEERLTFDIRVRGGLRPITVYANRKFATQLYDLSRGNKIRVYGSTVSITSSSRMDQGFTGGSLCVELHKIERI